MRLDCYRGSVLSMVLAALFALFLAVDIDPDAGPARLRGLAAVQRIFRWLAVEPLGMVGATVLVLTIGIGCAVMVRPKY